jgi:hypothetical protein
LGTTVSCPVWVVPLTGTMAWSLEVTMYAPVPPEIWKVVGSPE